MARGKAGKSITAGTVLGGKYRIEGIIGQGGMAVVFMARHIELGRRVAIKVLQERYHKDGELVTRFMREAQAAVRLRSEHVVKVSDVGKANGGPYMVMELLEGEDLDRVLSRQPLPIPYAVDCILQACEAVAEAHGMGIVHRDLKPKNMFLVPKDNDRPFVKVLDFGLAKHIALMEDQVALTGTTAVLGSPHYMSPEQMRASKNVDGRTDIWALGVSLYELLTGHTPFPGETVAVVCAQVLKQPPVPITTYLRDAPLALVALIDRCLQKDPSARFPNVHALAHALEPFAPPHAKGSADRIAKILRALPTMYLGKGGANPPARVGGDTHTGATLDSDPGARRSRWITPLAITVSVFVVGLSAMLLAFGLRAPARTRADTTITPQPDPSQLKIDASLVHGEAGENETPPARAGVGNENDNEKPVDVSGDATTAITNNPTASLSASSTARAPTPTRPEIKNRESRPTASTTRSGEEKSKPVAPPPNSGGVKDELKTNPAARF